MNKRDVHLIQGPSLLHALLLTATVRDVCADGMDGYKMYVSNGESAVWENNPYVKTGAPSIAIKDAINCDLDLTHCLRNESCHHLFYNHTLTIAERLGVQIMPQRLRGDVYLSDKERFWLSQVGEVFGQNVPFWLMATGGALSERTNEWPVERYQEVVDYFKGKILFVRVGSRFHGGGDLDGVIDLRGQTNIRQLVRLLFHSHGLVTPVSALVHLAAAIEGNSADGLPRSAVVIGGGSVSPGLYFYPENRALHTIGALSCCSLMGCGKFTVISGRSGKQKGIKEVCSNSVAQWAKCMMQVATDDVIAAIEASYLSKERRYLDANEMRCIAPRIGWRLKEYLQFIPKTDPSDNRGNWTDGTFSSLTERNAVRATWAAVEARKPGPLGQGRGIVICGGGLRYLAPAWVCIKMLRWLGCRLPIELWHLPEEMAPEFRALLNALDVKTVDAGKLIHEGRMEIEAGWSLKAFALMHSSFNETLLLDADNVPVRNPEYLFDGAEFHEHGAIFWPDYGKYSMHDAVWRICGVPYREEPQFESGQILVDKSRCWRELNLALWYNLNAGFFYHYFLGDKETFHFAFRFLDHPYSMPSFPLRNLGDVVMCQHDFKGKRVFQHRNRDKWKFFGKNRWVRGFTYQAECLAFLQELRRKWTGRTPNQIRWQPLIDAESGGLEDYPVKLQEGKWWVHVEGAQASRISFQKDGTVIPTVQTLEIVFWDLKAEGREIVLRLASEDCLKARLCCIDGNWNGGYWDKTVRKAIWIERKRSNRSRSVFINSAKYLCTNLWAYRFGTQHQRSMRFAKTGEIIVGTGELEVFWRLIAADRLEVWNRENRKVTLQQVNASRWSGALENDSAILVELLLMMPIKSYGRVSEAQELRGFKVLRGEDFAQPYYALRCRQLRERVRFHRKQWEYVMALEALMQLRHAKRQLPVCVLDPELESFIDALTFLQCKVSNVLLPTSRIGDWSADLRRRVPRLGALNEVTICNNPAQKLEFRLVSQTHNAFTQPDSSGTPRVIVGIGKLHQLNSPCAASLSLNKWLEGLRDETTVVLTGDIAIGDTAASIAPGQWKEALAKCVRPLRRAGFQVNCNVDLESDGWESFVDTAPYESEHHCRLLVDGRVLTSAICVATKRRR